MESFADRSGSSTSTLELSGVAWDPRTCGTERPVEMDKQTVTRCCKRNRFHPFAIEVVTSVPIPSLPAAVTTLALPVAEESGWFSSLRLRPWRVLYFISRILWRLKITPKFVAARLPLRWTCPRDLQIFGSKAHNICLQVFDFCLLTSSLLLHRGMRKLRFKRTDRILRSLYFSFQAATDEQSTNHARVATPEFLVTFRTHQICVLNRV